jgi:hypothetical protein
LREEAKELIAEEEELGIEVVDTEPKAEPGTPLFVKQEKHQSSKD